MAARRGEWSEEQERVRKGIQQLPVSKQSEDCADLARNISTLSPTTQEYLGVLLRSISKGEAQIDTDSEGRTQIQYSKQIYWDGSNANVIAQPKSDPDINIKVDACLELIGYFKSEKHPSGVVLDKTKISLSPSREYRPGHEFMFHKTKQVLGSGNSAGDIMVVKDMKTGQEHAHKTMMISYFRKEEIRCWVDMSDTGYVPALYLFKIENNKVSIHMEILKHAKTLRSIIDEHMARFYDNQQNISLVKPFSLFVLDGELEAVAEMHSRGWVHNDLHGGNVMIQKTAHEPVTCKVKVLDFGLASKLEGEHGINFRGFRADIAEVLRLFCALYTGGLEFDNAQDIQHNWESKLQQVKEYTKMDCDDKKELFCLVDAAMKVIHPHDLQEYRDLVRDKLERAMGDSERNILSRVVAILFPEDFQPVHSAGTLHPDADDEDDEDNSDCIDSHHSDTGHHSNTGDHGDTDVDGDTCNGDQTASQVSDEYMDKMRLTLGISLQ